MKSEKLVLLSSATIFQCLKFTFAFQLNIPKPDTVFLSVPTNQYENIQWLENPNYMKSTCGTFTAYETKTVEKVVGRWYTIYVSNIPKTTDYCSQFTNVQSVCRCSGIDFTIAIKYGSISFVMFSRNIEEDSVTYELATASFSGNRHLNMNQIILRSFIIPHGVVVDSDDFKSYIIMVFCKERAVKPIVMILVNELPISEEITNTISKYLNDNHFDSRLLKVRHHHCKHGQNIVGNEHD
ncbi:hypothetical protein QTP88_023568 [Uroleucon formosanum]